MVEPTPDFRCRQPKAAETADCQMRASSSDCLRSVKIHCWFGFIRLPLGGLMSSNDARRPMKGLALVLALLIAVSTSAWGQGERRIALVVGNAAYTSAGALANPVNDANDIAAALKGLGFEVFSGTDLDKRSFDMKLREFSRALPKSDVALFFYAGHGLQVSGRNFLVPVDAQLQGERDLDFEGVSLDFVLKQMELERDGKTSIVLLDACRDNPLARNLARTMGTRSAAVGQGLAQVQAGVGTFVAYSTQPGNVALDGQGRNSPFTAALTKALSQPERTLTSIMIDVRKDVLASTKGRQVPWDHSALTGEFYFKLASASGAMRQGTPSAPGTSEERLRQLEEEIKKRADPQQTAKVVELAQSRERLKRLDEENRRDQKRISDIMMARARNPGAQNDPFEIGNIQMEIGKRSGEMRKLRERVAELEAELGLAQPKPTAKQ